MFCNGGCKVDESLVLSALPGSWCDFSTKLSTGPIEGVENHPWIIDLGSHLKFYFKLMLRRTQTFAPVSGLSRMHKVSATGLHHAGVCA
jgi:hypothetical protein